MVAIVYHPDTGSRRHRQVIHLYHAFAAPRAVPMALESVHAGFPSVAQDYFSGEFSFDEHLIEHPDTTFIITVAGDSMQGAGIWDGDLLVVDRSLTPQSGDVVIAVLDGELTVKRLLRQSDGPILHPENSLYPDFRPSPDEDLVIWGVVTGNFHWQSRGTRHSPVHDRSYGPTRHEEAAGPHHDAESRSTPQATSAQKSSEISSPGWFDRSHYPNRGWA